MNLSSRARRERRKWRRYQRTHRYRLAAERFAEAMANGLVVVAPMGCSMYYSQPGRKLRNVTVKMDVVDVAYSVSPVEIPRYIAIMRQ